MENHQKIARYIVANTKRRMLVLVDFQNDYYSETTELYTS